MEHADSKSTDEKPSTTTTIIKTTTYGPSSGANYRTTVTPRNIVINRTAYGGSGSLSGGSTGSSRSLERSARFGSSTAGPNSGAYALVSSTGVTAVKESREQEKKDMQDLNERFAGYIERVRFLEAQNRKLADELDKLKSRWGKETSQIKSMYQAELDEARKLLDSGDKDKARLEIRIASLEEQLQELNQRLDEATSLADSNREVIEKQNAQLADNDAELGLLRKRLESYESDREREKKKAALLQDALNRTRADLDNETLQHIDAENKRQTLAEEIEFLKSIHEQELKELTALAYRDTTPENREFWKNEMGQALREIQQIYDEKLDIMKSELETFYDIKMQEFRLGGNRQALEAEHAKEEAKRFKTQLAELREKLNDLEAKNSLLQRELDFVKRERDEREKELENENNELKNEVAKLRAELEAILKELQDIMDTKLGLELEIAAYRKLLEGEESRVGLKQVVDSLTSGSDDPRSASGRPGGEISARTTYQKSAKGPLSITECSADGKFIVIENTGRKEEILGGWKLKRNVDGDDQVDYTFKKDIVVKPFNKVKFWSDGSKPASATPNDVATDQPSWGTGSNITTKLINNAGEELATHAQKTTLI